MSSQLVTRDRLRRELVVSAAKKPLAIGVGLLVFVAGLALGTVWLFPVALVVYAGLVVSTVFDGAEAERVGRRAYERARGDTGATSGRALPSGLSSELVELIQRARIEERRILDQIAVSELPFDDVSTEVEELAREMERIAARAQTVTAFLVTHDGSELRLRLAKLLRAARQGDAAAAAARERAAAAIQDQLRVGEALESELERFRAEMEHLIASLGVVHGQLVRISVSYDPQVQEDVAREVRDLRTRVGALADGLRDATESVEHTV